MTDYRDAPEPDAPEDTVTEGEDLSRQDAIDFVDREIDSTEDIESLSVEAFVTLAILRVVRSPEDVRVHVTRSQRMVILEYEVREDDIGQVIGRGGHTIDAIRSLAKSITGKVEDSSQEESEERPPHNPVEYIIKLIDDTGSPVRFGKPRGDRRRQGHFHRNRRGRYRR